MEIAYCSHEHPLVFADGESEDNQDETVVCWGCEDLICGPRFSCFTCKFHLHKSCTELPPRLLGHPLHPQHALSLLPRSSYASKGYRCDACDGEGNGFVYHCSQCDFDLDIMCALSNDQEGNIVLESTAHMDHFRYGLHQHLLVLEEELSVPLETNSVDCFGCSESISAPFFYCSRSRCEFRIHKFCANLPKQIKVSFFHPELSLFLVPKSFRDCGICGQQGKSFYVHLEHGLFIHPKCAFTDPRDTMKKVGEKHIQHRSHPHNLTLLKDEKEWAWIGNHHPSCCLCMEQVNSSPSYGCELCPFILHKYCAELPGQIKSHLHPKHSLILFATTQSRRIINCGYCAIAVSKLNFCCLHCGFTLHVDCFFSLLGYDHHHSFVQLKTFRKLACDACGLKDYFSPWQCTSCHLMVHKNCAELSSFLRLDGHNHVLKLTYYLYDVIDGRDKQICELCYREVNVDYAAYYCHLCNYVAHLSCAQVTGVVVSEEETQDISNIPLVKSNSGAITLSEDASKDGEIRLFSHQHELTLNEEDPEDHKYCERCVTLVSSPFYSCRDCDFYLHKRCAEMPETNKFSFHPHPLHLNHVEEIQYCYECGKAYNGFMYSCQIKDCHFAIDFHCVILMEGGLDHPCHEHSLFFPDPRVRNCEKCQGCGLYNYFILVCSGCDYVLGFCCAKLPHRIKHRYDDHLLSLAFKNEDDYRDHYCDICENERNPKDQFYYCTKCDFFAHTECALGSLAFIKFGTTCTFDSHDHPLTYVEQPMRKPPPLCCVCDTDNIKKAGRKRSGSLGFRIRDHVQLGSKLSETVKGKLRLGATIIQKGGRKNMFKQIFAMKEGEELLKASQCYLSTTAGPIPGLLFVSTQKVAFCSETNIVLPLPSGEIHRTPYKVVIPIGKIRRPSESENEKEAAQKYIQIVTEDGCEFWFMGFLRYEKALLNLEKAISMANPAGLEQD